MESVIKNIPEYILEKGEKYELLIIEPDNKHNKPLFKILYANPFNTKDYILKAEGKTLNLAVDLFWIEIDVYRECKRLLVSKRGLMKSYKRFSSKKFYADKDTAGTVIWMAYRWEELKEKKKDN